MLPPSRTDVAVGREIRRQRRLAGMTQQQVAARIGVTGAQFHRYETGATRLVASRLVAIAGIFGIRPDSLLAATIDLPPTASASAVASPARDIVDLLHSFAAIQDPGHRNALMTLVRMMSPAHPEQASQDTAAFMEQEQ